MILPNKWGQGQLFAFSALDGPSYFSDDFTGMLSGDRIGIRFFSKVKREFSFANIGGRNLEFDAVTSDYICFHFPNQPKNRLLYVDRHLIIGNVSDCIIPKVFVEGRCLVETLDDTEIHDTQDSDFTALLQRGNRFAYAFGHSREEVLSLSLRGILLDIETEEQKKLDFYRHHQLASQHPYAKLYAKCLSVMKSQLYSPEADFSTIWSTPDRLPHKSLWLWDSVFHALGHRHLDCDLAINLIRAIWVHQRDDGFIPHMANVYETSQIIQPPVMAWGTWQIYTSSRDKTFLADSYEHNKRFLSWCHANRRTDDKELYTWSTTEDANCRCDECGMDNSPRFDIKKPLWAIDFSCFMANDVRFMKKIADELGYAEDSARYEAWFCSIKEAVNQYLWSETDCFYFDRVIESDRLHKVWSVASFLPLFAGICTPKQAECLAAHLKNPESFATPFPIPSISKKDATFGTDMWRGPVWINYNYMITQGLREYGYGDFADEILRKTIQYINYWYDITGTIFEFYDCNNMLAPSSLNRKGLPFEPYNINVRLQSIRDYGWSCTLLCDIIQQTGQ